ncbi:HD-GYP domain-containing protein [Heliorestis convoluta]|uniref:HD-GYP domain-containing protein n=1 Tax=Heliorestis convoluta TaxID=356322 RepID=A0A5Q2MYA9_9FIRM|nr:HD-GYP domain-containing protein [Heliorestis convoluta]QGG47617.1 HD-GYP domain-containing protein [Heliorestis convoluta]
MPKALQRIPLKMVEDGCVLALPILDEKGSVLLGKGVKLTSKYVDRLKRMGVDYICIETPGLELVSVENAISQETVQFSITDIRKTLNNVGLKKNFCLKEIEGTVESIIYDMLKNRNIMLDIQMIKHYDEYTYTHSLSVAAISLAIGIKLGMNVDTLRNLGIGAILHDVGKLEIDKEILNKPGPLTKEEYEKIKQHSKIGYDLIKTCNAVLAAHVALQHQERFNGSGYPRAVSKNDIHLFGRISAVADVYDALTSERPQRPAWSSLEAYEYVVQGSGKQFDPRIIKLFQDSVTLYSNGMIVKLSTGENAIVVSQNDALPNRPVVFTLKNGAVNKKLDLKEIENSHIVIAR